MGTFAEECAADYQFTREAQDAYAVRSLTRARAAIAAAPSTPRSPRSTIRTRKGETQVSTTSSRARRARQDPHAEARVPQGRHGHRGQLQLDFRRAAALVLMRAVEAERRGVTPLAGIAGHATHARRRAGSPSRRSAPSKALRTSAGAEQVDLFEVNEAFAMVAMVAMHELGLPERVNIHGGACAQGHPIGSSGARIVVTLLAALERRSQAGHRGAVHRRRRGHRDGGGANRLRTRPNCPERALNPETARNAARRRRIDRPARPKIKKHQIK